MAEKLARLRQDDRRSCVPSAETVELSANDLLEASLAEQRRDWLTGRRVSAAEHLRVKPTLRSDPACAAELIYHEFLLRGEIGESPEWDHYLQQFPQFTEQLEALRLADELTRDIIETPGQEGSRIGDYEILEQIGSGGMGVVYRAIQKPLGRTVAVKLLRGGEFADPAELDRFMKEALAVSQLNHPNIAQIYNVGATEVRPFIAFEFVDGSSFADRINGTPLPARLAASIVEIVSRAIQYANDHGIVHRDLKPANVLLSTTADGEVPKVTDFGACKRINERDTHERTQIVGTPAYMAPEQLDLAKQVISVRTDVYGLGAILYECLTGLPPFRGESVAEVLRQVVEEMPIAPRLLTPRAPRDLETICLKCLQKSPKDRYESAAAVADDLRRFLNGEPVKARPLGPVGRTWRWCRRKPGTASLVAVLLMALLGGMTGITVQWRRAEVAHQSALASDREAQELLNELLETTPAVRDLGDQPIAASVAALSRAEAHCKTQLQKNPGDIKLRIALTEIYGCLGTLSTQKEGSAEANAIFQRARDLWEPLVSEAAGDPVCRDWLATTCSWYASDARPQLQSLQRAECIWQKLADEQPGNLKLMQNIWRCRTNMMIVIDQEAFRSDFMQLLEANRMELRRLLRGNSADRALRKRLALACFLLGEIYSRTSPDAKATAAWRESCGHYQVLVTGNRDDVLSRISLAICCSRLIQGEAADPYYRLAVPCLEQAGQRIDAILGEQPQLEERPLHCWLRHLLLEDYCCLALCHIKAGQTAKAEQVSNECISRLTPPLDTQRVQTELVLDHVVTLLSAGQLLSEARQSGAALRLTGQAAALCSQLADHHSHNQAFLYRLGDALVNCSAMANRLGEPALALAQAELGRRSLEEWMEMENAPESRRHEDLLSAVCERIGKARWGLGQRDQALAAFRESAALQKHELEREPSNPAYRASLSACYNRLSFYHSLTGDLRGAADAILERTKLWPNNPEQLAMTAEDFSGLAKRVTARSQGHLSHEDEAERDHYLAESRRLRVAAEAATHREGHDLRVER
jgi:tetratricopeptide (TPR) repeat protein